MTGVCATGVCATGVFATGVCATGVCAALGVWGTVAAVGVSTPGFVEAGVCAAALFGAGAGWVGLDGVLVTAFEGVCGTVGVFASVLLAAVESVFPDGVTGVAGVVLPFSASTTATLGLVVCPDLVRSRVMGLDGGVVGDWSVSPSSAWLTCDLSVRFSSTLRATALLGTTFRDGTRLGSSPSTVTS